MDGPSERAQNSYYAAFEAFIDRVTDPTHPEPPPKRPKEQAILTAARALFSKKGFAATTTAAIAAAADTTEKTLFKYFPSKDDLIVNVCLDAVVENMSGIYLDTYLQTMPPREALIGFLTDKTKACLAGEDGFRLFLQAILLEHDMREALVQVLGSRFYPQTESSMARLGDMLGSSDFDPLAFNFFVFALLIGYDILRTILLPSWQADDEANIAQIVDILLYGFARRDQASPGPEAPTA